MQHVAASLAGLIVIQYEERELGHSCAIIIMRSWW